MAGKKKEIFALDEKEKKECALLAKKAIKHALMSDSKLSLSNEEASMLAKKLCEKKACFVTLMEGKNLRGCIGHLNAIQPLYKDIMENAVAAALNDPRFEPLSPKEFSKVSVEVSILTNPVDLEFTDAKDLLGKIVAGEDGLIISKGYCTATFLPSVWEELPKKEVFLSHLCVKAGLGEDEWKKPGIKVQKYKAIKAE